VSSSRLRVACAASALAVGLACGPQGPLGILPGGPLAGEVVAEPVDDWSFSDAHLTVAIETQGAWLDHSVTVLCVAYAGSLYVPSRNPTGKRWVRNVEHQERVRIGVEGRIYPARAERVTSLQEAEAASRALLRKYLGIEASEVRPLPGAPEPGDDRAEVLLFRISSVGGAS